MPYIGFNSAAEIGRDAGFGLAIESDGVNGSNCFKL